MTVILAETVAIDGGVLLLVLVVFMVMVATWCGLVALGCFWARRAGLGSRPALAGWMVVVVAQTVPLAIEPTPLLLIPVAAAGIQTMLYILARRQAEADVQ